MPTPPIGAPWSQPASSPASLLSVLELVASEGPHLLPVVVDNLASSPARSALLELAASFDVSGPAELAAVAVNATRQLDKLLGGRWKLPSEVLGTTALPTATLDAFVRRRVDRAERRVGKVPPALRRLAHRIKDAGGLERARAVVEWAVGTK